MKKFTVPGVRGFLRSVGLAKLGMAVQAGLGVGRNGRFPSRTSAPAKATSFCSVTLAVIGLLLMGVLQPFCVEAQSIILINTNTLNGSFEYTGPGAGTFQALALTNGKAAFNLTANPGASFGPVPAWTVWTGTSTTATDSGVENTGNASQGKNVAYLQPGNAEYNLTSKTIEQGDVFTYSWDWVAVLRGPATVQLGYFNGITVVPIPGTATTASNVTQVLGVTTNWTVPAGDPSIGRPIALTMKAPPGANYPEVDNFVLTVNTNNEVAGGVPIIPSVPVASSGTFQFTTGSYNISANEGTPAQDSGLSLLPSLLGARVTVTRTGGASGRVQVPYSGAASGTLVFDDYQMSASILVAGGTVTLGTPTLDPLESSDLLPPSLGEPSAETVNVIDPGSNPTNSVINLERATFRIDKDKFSNAIIHVMRTPNSINGAQDVGVTVQYAINQALPHPVKSGFGGNPAPGNTFALEAGSDYAVANTDFTPVSGTVSFAANQLDQTITIPILQSGQVEFNKDLQLQIFIPTGATEPAEVGGVSTATLTILSDSYVAGLQPAGSVDRTWNKDNSDGFDSNPPYLQYPGTKGGVSDTANGNGGTVFATVEQPDGKAILAGSFNSFDSHTYNRIVRVLTNGYQDTTFLVAPNSGANDVIYSMALQPDGKIIIGGNFTAFNGVNRYHVARLNSDGSVDASFNPGSGADGTVWAVAVRLDGKIVIGGDFTHYNGTESSYVARLNGDGSVDTSFVPGTSVNGPVYALAMGAANTLDITNTASGGAAENDNPVSLGNANSGLLSVSYDMLQQPDDMRIYYGDTNGFLVYDTGNVSGTNSFVVSFGPTNGFSTNLITIVMNQNGGQFGTLWSYTASLTTFNLTKLAIGGAFDSIGGVDSGCVARLNDDGTLDTSFAAGIGTYNPVFGFFEPVNALAMQGDKLLVGGSFSYMELANYNGLVRLSSDGSVDTTFNPGSDFNNGTYNPVTGLADSIYAIALQPDGKILIGGDFTTYNQTRRVGIARLFDYGSLDTSFMDTAYNQFAGLINHYHNPDAVNNSDYPQGNHRNFVSAIAVETTSPNNVIIGGNFLRVGGGSVWHSGSGMSGTYYPVYPDNGGIPTGTSSGIFANGRMDIHPRSNVARLIGGATPGPGNISLSYGSYSADKSAGTLYVSIDRTNGSLGVISASCAPTYQTSGPGIATTNDLTGGATPAWPTLWSLSPYNSWTVAPGTFGPNYIYDSTYAGGNPNQPPDVYFNILYNTNITGNLNAKIDLSAPNGSNFSLGGEVIPLGTALGFYNLSPLTIIDTNIKPGVFGFSSPTYTVNQGSTATITVTRTNGSDNTVQINYATANGTAISPANYTAVNGTLTFGPGVISKTFTVPTAVGTTTNIDRTVSLQLSSVTGGGIIGQTNAVLTIVNNTFANGHISFTVTNYSANETAGTASVTVNRLGGSTGTLDATAIVGGGTAVNGVNYIASTNALHWNNADLSVKTISIPVIHDGVVTPNLLVNLRLTNGLANNVANGKVLGLSSVTNATLTIVNVDFPGTVEFSSGVYSVKKSAGYAIIPVIRTGGSAQTVTVNFSTKNGSATSGVNYTATNGVLTFTNGVVSQYFAVRIIDDGQTDGLLALNVVLSNATPGISLGSPSNAVLNIIDTATVDEPPGSIDPTYSPFAGFNGDVNALALQSNNQLIVGGDFTMANSVPRQRLARLNANGSLDSSFLLPSSTMGADGQIHALAIQTDGRIIVGGLFSNFNSVAESGITRLNYDGSLDSTFNPGSGADNPVYSVAQSPVDHKILVGGAFATLNGVTFNGVGRLNTDGTPDTSFNPGGLGAGSPGSSSAVFALVVQSNGQILIGGDFTTYNGVTVNHLARLNTDGSLDASFIVGTGASDSVHAIAIQADGKILIGGLFTDYSGAARNYVARLNNDGSVDGGFTPGVGANDAVSSIALQTDGRIVLGGQFTQCSGVTRNRLTRLNSNGTVDPTINFGSGANDEVNAVVVQQGTIQGYPTNVPDEKIIIGGAFTQYNGQPHPHLARIFGGSVSGSGAIEFSSADYQVDENGLNAFITVVRTGGTSGTNSDGSGDIFVPFATSDGSAKANINYGTVITNLDFPMGEVQQIVRIPVIDDGVITSNLTVNMAVNPLPPTAYGNQPTAVLTILNDDSGIRFATATYQVPKNTVSGTAAINIVRFGSANGTASVIFNTTTNGTAVADVDYTPVTDQLVTFNPGITNVVVTIPIINNSLVEYATTVTMELTNAINSTLASPSNALLTIIDTVNSPGSLTFLNTNLTVSEGGANAYITVYRTNGISGTISARYGTVAGTALPSINYTTTTNTITFAPGVTTNTIIVPLLNNNLVQGPVNFSVILTPPMTGGGTLIAPTNISVTILDNDNGFAFVNATNYFRETDGVASVFVQRIGGTNGSIQVNYATTNGSALSGTNYTTTSGTLSFANGETIKAISIPLLYDPRVTGDLNFTMKLSSPSGGSQLGAPSNTVVVIQDADAGISFTNAAMSVSKSAGYALITVVCSNPSVEPVATSNTPPLSVQYFTQDGSAVAGIHYTAVSGTLFFTNGIATNTFIVPILANGAVDSNRTFTVSLTNATAPGKLVAPSNQVVTIVEANNGFSFSSPTYTVLRSGIAATITVLRSGNTDSVASVNFSATNGTAVNGLDYFATNGTFVFTNGQLSKSFSVPVIANTTVQPDKTVLLQLFNPTNGILVAPSAATLTIHDTSGSLVVPAGSAFAPGGDPNNNGIIDPGETVTMLFALRDSGGTNAVNVTATLLVTNGVTSPSPVSQNYGTLIAAGPSASRSFSFTANGTNSQVIAPTFQLKGGASGTNNLGIAVFTYTLGSWTTSFTNPAVIIINDYTMASPYPSLINVSGIGGMLIKATITLTNMSHSSPQDVDALLVAPNQQDTLFMAHAGGQVNMNRVTLTFEDATPTNSLPSSALIPQVGITNGTYNSTGYLPIPKFP